MAELQIKRPVAVGRRGKEGAAVWLLASRDDIDQGNTNGPAQVYDERTRTFTQPLPLQQWFKFVTFPSVDAGTLPFDVPEDDDAGVLYDEKAERLIVQMTGAVKGGPGSGYHDPHVGLPGVHGGSAPRDEAGYAAYVYEKVKRGKKPKPPANKPTDPEDLPKKYPEGTPESIWDAADDSDEEAPRENSSRQDGQKDDQPKKPKDTIKLKRIVQGEFGERVYTMTGDNFTTMKDAVKDAGGKFQSTDKTWLVNGGMLKNLGETFGIEEEPPLRVYFSESSVEWRNNDSTRAMLSFEYRSNGGWRLIPMQKPVMVDTTSVAREAELQRLIEKDMQTLGKPFPYSDFQVVRSLARRAINQAGEPIVDAAMRALNGRYTKEAMTEAMSVMKKEME